MTEDRRPVEVGADSLAALYRLLEDARRYEGYAEDAGRAYDEELADLFREVCVRSPADRLSGPGSCSRSGWPTAAYTSRRPHSGAVSRRRLPRSYPKPNAIAPTFSRGSRV